MTTLVLNLDPAVVEAARARARRERTTVEAELGRLLAEYATDEASAVAELNVPDAIGPRTMEELDAELRRFHESRGTLPRPEFTPEERGMLADRAWAAIDELRKHVDTSGVKMTREERNAR